MVAGDIVFHCIHALQRSDFPGYFNIFSNSRSVDVDNQTGILVTYLRVNVGYEVIHPFVLQSHGIQHS